MLRTHDRYGHRVDEVDFHPSWHALMDVAVGSGLHAAAWSAGAGGHVRRAAGFVVWSQVEAGHGCPVSMTYAAVPALRTDPDLAAALGAGAVGHHATTPGCGHPPAKAGLLAGMGMTEKQGGSDVRANTTRAEPLAADGEYLLTGHKWFCSAPMCDLFLVLAQAPGGLTCFVVPRVLPDGVAQHVPAAAAEGQAGQPVERVVRGRARRHLGPPARRRGPRRPHDHRDGLGDPARLRPRLDRADAPGGAQATHHAAHRRAFGGLLADKPLMQNVLADLAVESEAATALAMRLAHAVDSGERELRRLAVAVGKYWVCKRAPAVVGEALECLGGNGYVEESGLPRLYREAPLNSIWEGSGNVNALDVLRALAREPAAVEAFQAEVGLARGADPRLDAAADRLGKDLVAADEGSARRLVESMALVLQGSLLVRHSPAYVADAFCASRLAGDHGQAARHPARRAGHRRRSSPGPRPRAARARVPDGGTGGAHS